MQLDLFTSTAIQTAATLKKKPHLEDVLEAISSLDIKWLEYLLDESTMYSDFPKWVFIKKMKWVFDDFRHNENLYLKYYPGKCTLIKDKVKASALQGFRFIGNESKDHIDLLFETDGEYIQDIVDSLSFQSQGTELFIGKQIVVRYQHIDGWNSTNEVPF